MKKVLAACGVVGAFSLGWIISKEVVKYNAAEGLGIIHEDGFIKFGETVDGVFNELPVEECAEKMKKYYND